MIRASRLFSTREINLAWLALLSILLFSFIILRFFHLDADFPSGVDWSGDLYTDEGWYANAAIREVVSGKWYLAGDFNPAINLPVGQILQGLAFGIFGLSLFSARLSVAVSFTLVIILAALIVRRGAGIAAGVLAALLLSSSYLGFAYSRMAVMEPIGLLFVMAALFLAQRAQGSRALPWLILAAFMVGVAVLVKSNMIFAVPVIAYMAWLKGRRWQDRLIFSLASVAASLLVVEAWQITARHLFYSDYVYFNQLNLGTRRVSSIGGWISNLAQQLRNMLTLGKIPLAASAILVAGAALVSPAFRKNTVVRAMAIHALAYFAVLSIVVYGPPRYFLPLTVPLAGLTAIACIELAKQFRMAFRFRPYAGLPFLLAAAILLSGWVRIGSYIASPHYSFLQMTSGVGEIIHRREGRLSGVILLGNMADSVALETGVKAVNTVNGTLPLGKRLEKYHPAYVLVHTDEANIMGSIHSLGRQATRLGAWDVFGNYYGRGQKIRLFAVNWSNASAPVQASPR
jgi:4-amino-4-deoxy-L-arabinose transferase-like glycosyltransferase